MSRAKLSPTTANTRRMSRLEIVAAVEAGDWPPAPQLEDLARRAVAAAEQAVAAETGPGAPAVKEQAEVSLVFTDDANMRQLNRKWRGRDRATNVLSFPQAGLQGDPQAAPGLLGDVILAEETVRREAALAEKSLEDHMAHLIIHGFLHLLGYDHEAEADAEKMEQLERVALKSLGIQDPYATAPRQ
jgi:probable rRNA maturation factor